MLEVSSGYHGGSVLPHSCQYVPERWLAGPCEEVLTGQIIFVEHSVGNPGLSQTSLLRRKWRERENGTEIQPRVAIPSFTVSFSLSRYRVRLVTSLVIPVQRCTFFGNDPATIKSAMWP